MDPKYNAFYEKYKDKMDVDDIIPSDYAQPVIKYCKIDCLGNKLTYDSVQAAFECTRVGRAGYSTITYDPFAYTIECESVYEFYLDHIRDVFKGQITVEFKRE